MSDTFMEHPTQSPKEHESPWWAVALLGGLVLIIVVGILMNRTGKQVQVDRWITLLGVVATLAIFTILYKENPIFRFMEHIFIGLATGIGVAVVWVEYLYPKWLMPMMPAGTFVNNTGEAAGKGQWWLIFTLLLGLLFYTVYFPRLSWMNRFMLGIVMGWAAGYMWGEFVSLLGPQIITSFKSPVTAYAEGAANINNIPLGHVWLHPWALIFIVVLLCTLSYFFFSVEHRTRWIRTPAVAGRYFLMITLGAIFGTTVMGRFSLVIERLDFLTKSFQMFWHALFG